MRSFFRKRRPEPFNVPDLVAHIFETLEEVSQVQELHYELLTTMAARFDLLEAKIDKKTEGGAP